MAESHYEIDISLIDNPGHDARMGLEVSEFDDLYVSIRENGILQPILVRPRGDRYEVIAGNRRLQVARKLGLSEVPAMVRNASDIETSIFRFEENLKRAELNPVEEAKYIAEAITALGIPLKDFAQKINRSEAWIADRLSIAEMPLYLQGYLVDKTIHLGVALALNRITDETVRKDWCYFAHKNGMTVLAAQNAFHEWEKIDRRQQEAPEGAVVAPAPKEPPVAYAQCVKCGSAHPIQKLKFVRICNPICSVEEEG